jgi:hypothetical protein
LFCLFAAKAFAACPDTVNNAAYVLAGASGSGNGTNWTNAYTSFGTGAGKLNPAAMLRGCTYYVGVGSYNLGSQVVFSSPDSGTTQITIQAPTVAVHGTNTGWSNSFVGQAQWSCIAFDTDYWTFNGSYRGLGTGVPATDWRTGYGFYIYNSNGSGVPLCPSGDSAAVSMGPGGTSSSGTTIEYTEIHGSGDATGTYVDLGIFGPNAINPTIQYNYIHNVGTCFIKTYGPSSGSDTALVQYNWGNNNQSTTANHGCGITIAGAAGGLRTLVFRYNIFENVEGTSYFDTTNCSGCEGNWYAYGNIFFANPAEWDGSCNLCTPSTGTQDGLTPYYVQIFGSAGNPLNLTEFAFWNNTIYNLAPAGSAYPPGDCDWENADNVDIVNLYIQNNLYVNCVNSLYNPLSSGTVTRTYNSYFDVTNVSDTGTGVQSVPGVIPFVSTSADNFILNQDTATWTPLASLYNVDLLGDTRTSSRGALQFPEIYSPVNGSVLTGNSVTFQWGGYSGASAYWLDVGRENGGDEYYQSGSLSNTTFSQTVNSLPTDGSTVVATWYHLLNGTWTPGYYSYTAFSGSSSPGVITSPVPSSILSGSSVTFSWRAGVGASAYWLDAGTEAEGDEYYQSGNLGNVLTTAVSGLPTNGSTVYVTLYSLVNGQWTPTVYTYTAFAGGRAAIYSPASPSTLTGSSVTFQWNAVAGAYAYWLDVGTVAGADQYYQSGSTTNTSATVNGLPTNGTQVVATLYTEFSSSGPWLSSVYTYTALGGGAAICSPASPSTLTGSSVTFQWNAVAGAHAYWLDVGTVAGADQYYQSGSTTNTSATVNGLPTNGTQVVATLYTEFSSSGPWLSNVYTYMAFSNSSEGVLTTPPPNTSTPLSGSTVTFTWNLGSGPTAYWLDVGNEPDGDEYYQSGSLAPPGSGSTQSLTVSGLPSNGNTVYVTLYSQIGGQWYGASYSYVASSNSSEGVLTTPPPNTSTPLSGSTVTFTWNLGSGPTAYWLDVGNEPEGDEYYQSGSLAPPGSGSTQALTVSGLPSNGNTIYVTLYSQIGGQWYGTSYTYVASSTGSVLATMISPVGGTVQNPGTLTGCCVTFQWTQGTNVTAYWLDVGNEAQGDEYYQSGSLSGTSTTVNSLPGGGAAVYVTLYSQIGGTWSNNVYVYTSN